MLITLQYNSLRDMIYIIGLIIMSYDLGLFKFETNNCFNNNIIAIWGKPFSGRKTLAVFLEKEFMNIYKIIDLKTLSTLYPDNQRSFYIDKIIELSKTKGIIFTEIKALSEIKLFKEIGAFTIKLEVSEKIRRERGAFIQKEYNNIDGFDDDYNWNCIYLNNGSLDDLRELARCISKIL